MEILIWLLGQTLSMYSQNFNYRECQLLGTKADPLVDTEITLEEILLKLNKCKNNKAPGAEEISFEFLKSLPENWIIYFFIIFNKNLKQEKVPNFGQKLLQKFCMEKTTTLHMKTTAPFRQLQ